MFLLWFYVVKKRLHTKNSPHMKSDLPKNNNIGQDRSQNKISMLPYVSMVLCCKKNFCIERLSTFEEIFATYKFTRTSIESSYPSANLLIITSAN